MLEKNRSLLKAITETASLLNYGERLDFGIFKVGANRNKVVVFYAPKPVFFTINDVTLPQPDMKSCNLIAYQLNTSGKKVKQIFNQYIESIKKEFASQQSASISIDDSITVILANRKFHINVNKRNAQ